MIDRLNPRLLGVALVAIALLLAPVVFSEQQYLLRVVTTAAIYAIAAYGLNIILGLTGQLSLAHGAFFGVGAYTVGLLTTDRDWPFWSAFLVAILATTVLGYVSGLIALRTQGAYFAIFTMALGFLIFIVIVRWESLTHAHSGVSGVKFPENIGPIDFTEPATMYYFVLIFLAAAAYTTHALLHSNAGRSLVAIRTSEDLAKSIGVNVAVSKQLAFTASATIAGLAGGLFASLNGFIGPDSAGIDRTFEMLLFLLIGGLGTVMGPLLGSLLVAFLFEMLQDLETYRFIVLGPIIVLLVIFAPRGMIGYLNDLVPARFKRRATTMPGEPATEPATVPAGSTTKDEVH
ncbi:branched-chain amino acid ABC transporter permease [Aeromicrobium sp. 636]|uniref:Branched-chain amino acid ABC transporter permease n=1 Tax=Aeromicrobium senzhongii TaxID=2663859 RepID=A0A8I0K1U4_9ACTN|nr:MULTISPECIES: branched-chain amino acid ABC transporter permease [Aeromicrobium]MBC9224980.1 branched-chain amino acid ABC transporter permease [Aeromicrobium senzhongii]MCQ3997091.1 branched-chain amino acid ABC transporter permease [Aeromicrobium sp. 636]MTB87025.1 branched-chain amino acid ABC transporter permease [Aeromicrobium senzhongii]QNL93154.1 branched-chain amino acid ABC transporter permease [Aeromicrobium senzhongii]